MRNRKTYTRNPVVQRKTAFLKDFKKKKNLDM